MTLWFLIALSLTIQEGLTVIAVLIRAYQLQYSLWIISAIWLVVTVLQIIGGYYLGKWIRKKFTGSKFEMWAERMAYKLDKNIHTSGERLALVLFASAISPGIGAFLASWLEISFANIFLFSLLGDFLWYLSTWATVLGAYQLLSRVKEGLLILIILLFVFFLIHQFRKTKSP